MDTANAGAGSAVIAPQTLDRRSARSPEPVRPTTLVSALIVLVLGALTVLAIYLPIRHLQAHNQSAPALEMPEMGMQHMNVFWAFPLLQAAGFAALIWAWVGLVLGLMESGGAARWRWLPLSPGDRIRLHRQVSILVLGLILVHAVATACDAMGDNVITAFVPFTEGYAPARFAFDLGIFAFYLAVLVGPTYYVRRWVGANRWRLVHRLAAVVYLLALWHTLIVGDDVARYPWIHPVIWLAQVPILALFVVRMSEVVRRSYEREATALAAGVPVAPRAELLRVVAGALAGLAVLAIVGVVSLVVTGSYGTVVSASPF
jgi:methionine sulfoxide reductase heme-binding subunit